MSSSTTCNQCGREWPEELELKYCGECGSALSPDRPDSIARERRTLTVLFADLAGFTSYSENRDPEEVEETINAVLQRLGDVVEAHGGHVDKYIGDAVMALFGAPQAHEDDPLRAVRAGLQMVEEVQAGEKRGEGDAPNFSLRVGVDRGEVVWSQMAGEDVTATGDAVNVAEQLEEAAEPNTVLVSRSVQKLTHDQIRYRQLSAIRVEGRNTAVQPYVAEEEKEHQEPHDRTAGATADMMGRDAELRRIVDRFETDGPSFLAVSGPAGIGKSRLLRAFEQHLVDQDRLINFAKGAAGAHSDVLREPFGDLLLFRTDVGRSDPGAGKKVRDVILGDLENSELPEVERENIAHLMALSVGLEVPDDRVRHMSPDQRRVETHRAWCRWVIEWAQNHPLVLLLEDLQWAGAPTMALLEHMVSSFQPENEDAPNLTMVASLRPEGKVPEGFEQMELTELPREACRGIAEEILGGPITESLAGFLKEETAGNPYFVEELVRYLLEEGQFRETDEGFELLGEKEGETEVPDTLNGLLVGRIDRLPEEEKDTMKAASVAGRRFWLHLLEETIDREARQEVRALSGRDMVFRRDESEIPGDLEYLFKHALLRDSAYGLLTKKARTRLHRAYSENLEEIARGEKPPQERSRSPDREGAGQTDQSTTNQPLAYFLTFTTFGTHLRGDETGSVDHDQNLYGTPFIPESVKLEQKDRSNLEQSPYHLDQDRRRVVLDQIKEIFDHRNWVLHAVHVRSNHVHLVVTAETSPDRVMNDVKSWLSRRLNEEGFENDDRKRWTRHGSTKYVWTPMSVWAVVRYTMHNQGEPMQRWIHPELEEISLKERQKETESKIKEYLEGLSDLGMGPAQIRESPLPYGRGSGSGSTEAEEGPLPDGRGSGSGSTEAEESPLPHGRGSGSGSTEVEEGPLPHGRGSGSGSSVNRNILSLAARHAKEAGDDKRAGELWLEAAREALAVGQFEEALSHAHPARETPREKEARLLLARGFRSLARYDQSLAEVDKILSSDPNTVLEARARLIAADVHESRSAHEEGLDAIGNLDKNAPEHSLRLRALNTKGQIFYRRGQYDEARHCFDQVLRLVTSKNQRRKISALVGLGNVHESLGEYEQALERYDRALQLSQKIGNRLSEARTLSSMGNIFNYLGKYERAKAVFQQSLEIKREIGDRHGEAVVLNNLGNLLRRKGEHKRAIAKHRQSLEIKRKIGDPRGEAASLGNIGLIHRNLGEYEKALRNFRQSLEIRREIGDRAGEVNSLNNIAVVHMALRNLSRSLEWIRQSLELSRKLGHRRAEAVVLENLGQVKRDLGEYEIAKEKLHESLEIKREIDEQVARARGLVNLAILYRHIGGFEQARKKIETAETISREIDDKSMLWLIKAERDRTKLDGVLTGQTSFSLDRFGLSLSLPKEMDRPQEIAKGHILFARVFCVDERFGSATERLNKVEELLGTIENDPKVLRRYLRAQAEIERARGNEKGAKKTAEQLLEIARESGERPWIARGHYLSGKHEKAKEIAEEIGLKSLLLRMRHEGKITSFDTDVDPPE